jgi:hypothetical protein
MFPQIRTVFLGHEIIDRELGMILKELGGWAQRWRSPRIPATAVK